MLALQHKRKQKKLYKGYKKIMQKKNFEKGL